MKTTKEERESLHRLLDDVDELAEFETYCTEHKITPEQIRESFAVMDGRSTLYAPVCIECWEPAERYGDRLRCSGHGGAWVTLRTWGHRNCQGHTARMEPVRIAGG